MKKISEEKIQNLYAMLQGDLLDKGVTIDTMPNLTASQAFSVIWYLQEQMRILPDCYEMCVECHRLMNTEEGMYSSNGDDEISQAHEFPTDGHYCEFCSIKYYDDDKYNALMDDDTA